MLIEIQGKIFNPDQIQTISEYCYMNDIYNEPVICSVVKFGLLNKIEFCGFSAKELQKEIERKIKQITETKE